MKEWVSIKEASKAVGKHPDTIRNFIRKNPSVIKKDERGKVYIKADTLKKHFALVVEKPETPKEETPVVEALLAELKQKNDEINRLHKLVEDMAGQQARLIDQQQQLSGLMLQASNSVEAVDPEEKPKKKHWWSR